MSTIITEDSAYQMYRDYAGNCYEYLSGSSTGKSAHVVGYDISFAGELLFIMSDRNNVPYKLFEQGGMIQIQGAIDNFVPKRRPNAGKSPEEAIDEKLGLMSEEEEREFYRRKNGYVPPTPQQARPVEAQEVSTNPVHLILDKRKDKPLISIPLFIDVEFISERTFTLIDSTFSDSIKDITDYFMAKVDFDNLKKDVEKGIEKYIKTKYLGMSIEDIEKEESVEIIQVEAEEV